MVEGNESPSLLHKLLVAAVTVMSVSRGFIHAGAPNSAVICPHKAELVQRQSGCGPPCVC